MRLMRLRGIGQSRRLAPTDRSAASMERVFRQFVGSLEASGYALHPLDSIVSSPDPRRAYLRHDVKPGDLAAGLRLANLHQKLKVPGTFHLTWDVIEGVKRFETMARRFGDFDPRYVRLGLQCDPLSRWLAGTRFDGDQAELHRFVSSPEFTAWLDEMLEAWRTERGAAPSLRAIRDGAWECLVALDQSFRRMVGECSSISGRGSPLSNAFNKARQARPELAAIAGWFSSIDFLVQSDLQQLGYAFEATRFVPGGGPGPVVVFGGGEFAELREAFEIRLGGGGGIVAIFAAEYWAGDRYADLLTFSGSSAPIEELVAPEGPVVESIPPEPFITREKHLVRFGWRCERVDKRALAAASRRIVGGAIDLSFPRFVDWLRSEGYVFDGFEEGRLRFDERRAYLRYDVHIQDLLAAYVLADLHERLGIVGSFQIMWKFSRYEEALEPYFTKLLEFDRRFVRFGLHAAPTASWYSYEKLAGDYSRQNEAVSSEAFAAWLLDLHAAYCRDGDDAPGLREIREGTDDTLSRIAASFRATFGVWKSISAHGNYLTNGFAEVCARHPEVSVLRPYFHPVDYLVKWGVARFGFDYEITALGFDSVPFPRVMLEGNPEEVRRRWYRGRVAHGAGFVALLHPATWTSSQNATFFLPEEEVSRPVGIATAGAGLRPDPPAVPANF
jgi:hypothetical protein